MKTIASLYHSEKEHRYYDCPIKDGKHYSSRVNSGKPFKVYHADGSFDLAYGFGEKQYTFDYTELVQAKKDYVDRRAWLKEHNTMIARLNELDNETLKEIVEKFCEKC